MDSSHVEIPLDPTTKTLQNDSGYSGGYDMDWIEGIGFAAATLTSIAFVPQAVQVWKSRSARDISLPMYLLFATGIALWLTYGLLIQSAPIIFANGFTLTMALAILTMKVRFDGLQTREKTVSSAQSLKKS